jgi:hypothetical protein
VNRTREERLPVGFPSEWRNQLSSLRKACFAVQAYEAAGNILLVSSPPVRTAYVMTVRGTPSMCFASSTPGKQSGELKHYEDFPDLLDVIEIVTSYLLHQVADAHLPALCMDAITPPFFVGELLEHAHVTLPQEAKEL